MKFSLIKKKEITYKLGVQKTKLFFLRKRGVYDLLYVDGLNIVAITLIFIFSYLAALKSAYILSGCLFFLLGISQFIMYFKKTKNFLNARGVFFFFWMSAIGLSALKLHPMQVMWKIETWVCIWLSSCLFLVGYNFALHYRMKSLHIKSIQTSSFNAILGVSGIIFIVFLIEVLVAGNVPLFSSDMSAYKTFSLPYLHYITVSCVLITPMSIIYLYQNKCTNTELIILLLVNAVMFFIPILIVSRQLLILGVIFDFFTVIELRDTSRFPKKYIGVFVAVIIVAWVLLSSSRNQSDEYIRAVLHLDDKMSVPLYRVYMYIAFNFDNFNDVVGRIKVHSYGLYSLNPLLTFTGLKGVWERVNDFSLPDRFLPVYTTYPFLVMPYEDFGVVGIAIYSIGMGYFAGHVEYRLKKYRSINNVLSHVVLNYCLVFCFFTAFLSNTSIWVYFIIIFIYDSIGQNTKIM